MPPSVARPRSWCRRTSIAAGLGDAAVIKVADTTVALQQAAAAWRDRFDPLVVGVTGSLAKTSTKEQIAEVLAERWTRAAQRGQREQRDRPATDDAAHGARSTRSRSSRWACTSPATLHSWRRLARPSIGVVTAVRGTHLSRAGSIDEIERGKRELVEALPSGGTAILNADDPRVARMADHVSAGVDVVTYGFDERADVRAEHVTSLGYDGMLLRAPRRQRCDRCDDARAGPAQRPQRLAAAAVGWPPGWTSRRSHAALPDPGARPTAPRSPRPSRRSGAIAPR